MSSVNDSNTALVVRVNDGESPRFSKEQIPIPRPEAHQVLVKLSHVAQNPTDVQSFDGNAFGDGVVLGCDFVGKVVELGHEVTRLVKGDIVAGLIWGGEIKGLGAYSQYCLADERIAFKVPEGISCAEASTVPLAAATAWLALLSKDCLALDRFHAQGTSVLVWGGSSSVGLYAIQLASHYGFEVVTTCSPRHAELVRAFGAKHVFDYKDETTIEKIKSVVPSLLHAFDTIGVKGSSGAASRCFAAGPGTICTVRPGKANTQDVLQGTQVTDVLVWTAFLKDHAYGKFKWPAHQHDHELTSELFERIPAWLQRGDLKPSRPKVLAGLDSVPDGFQEYRDGKVSAFKIVYEL
ncbi:hypothetical protein ASPACDRAFT_30664 [Aspergillus aculeatus ATCC 16872]|uniref:Enoyl reductase (ER) domain-containing protein n=1 Tax=Aspergillus aculeatus (strain ATCC 16872 / CBS 172.66 / WB 5094) TaxID=690307 RepID=A0A1L9WR64_ASPA1|nr:uncharacterized protein ASPACDRAFT_30664 [Aspergillus aculeatus ATCC 16872]OJJ98682.1 hypothetical protein ASPACDRAFT_30664 [Aspergillus aculeatus ATCC 16872]